MAPPSETSKRGPNPLRNVGNTALAKVAVLGLSGLLGIVTSRLIISEFGVDAYAQYGLLGTLPGLMPFADLGISAAVLTGIAASANPQTDLAVRRLLTSAFRLLAISGVTIALLSIMVGYFGWWPTLLGEGLMDDGGLAATLCVVLFGLAIPLSVGPRILIALGRNPLQIATQALVSPFMLGSIALVAVLGLPAGNYLALFSYIAAALVSVTCLAVGASLLAPQVRQAAADVPRLKSVPSVRVMDVGLPMLIQMLVLPIAMQSDRILLSHLGGSGQLAQYNLASQLFGIGLQTIMAAGVSLWPIFAKDRSANEIRSPFPLVGWFTLGGITIALAITAVVPFAAEIISDSQIEVGPGLAWSFVAFTAVQSAKYPLGMYMTDARGLWFQVPPLLVMVPFNVALSWAMVEPYGAAGPVAGSAISVFIWQVVPCAIYVKRDLAARRLEKAAS